MEGKTELLEKRGGALAVGHMRLVTGVAGVRQASLRGVLHPEEVHRVVLAPKNCWDPGWLLRLGENVEELEEALKPTPPYWR